MTLGLTHDHLNSRTQNSPAQDAASRRDFMKSLAIGTAGAGLASTFTAASYAKIQGANERVRIGVVGVRGMGFGHVRGYSGLKNVEVAAICDVDENVIAQRLGDMDAKGLSRPATFIDLRDLLDDPTIDAISVATPNHWHALAGLWAVQAGKHAT